MSQLIFLCLEVTVYNACYFRKLMKCFCGRVDKVAEIIIRLVIFYKTVRAPSESASRLICLLKFYFTVM